MDTELILTFCTGEFSFHNCKTWFVYISKQSFCNLVIRVMKNISTTHASSFFLLISRWLSQKHRFGGFVPEYRCPSSLTKVKKKPTSSNFRWAFLCTKFVPNNKKIELKRRIFFKNYFFTTWQLEPFPNIRTPKLDVALLLTILVESPCSS